MTNREMNASIKNELKLAGYNLKDFSVSVKDCGYSTSIKVTVKNPYVNRKDVESLLLNHQDIDKDSVTGEILEGGNTYLFVEYQYGLFEQVSLEWSSKASELMESTSEITRIFDGLYLQNINGILEIRQRNAKDSVIRRCGYKSLCEYLFKFSQFGTIAA